MIFPVQLSQFNTECPIWLANFLWSLSDWSDDTLNTALAPYRARFIGTKKRSRAKIEFASEQEYTMFILKWS